jgi:hypothetical protein
MNPLAIETAFKSALAVSFPTAVIHTGTSYEEIPPETVTLVVSVASVDHVAGNLWKAPVTIRVVSPALLGASALSDLDAALEGLDTAISSTSLTANWPSVSGTPAFCGVWSTGTKKSEDANSWVAEVEAVVGVSKSV